MKQVITTLFKSLSMARMLAYVVIDVGGNRSTRGKPTNLDGRPLYPLTYATRIGEKPTEYSTRG